MKINHFKSILDTKQREIENINSKMQLPVDQDILRMRIQKDLENKYRFEIDSKTQELDRVTENYFEVKRLHELAKTTIDSMKIDTEKMVNETKKRFRDEINELVQDNHALQLRIEDSSKEREHVRTMRRDLDDCKRRLCDA